jgi:hypothetical protein
MNAHELRINNWVMYDGRQFQIHAIDEQFPFLNTTEFGVGIVTYNRLTPIPLTPEVLRDCGFVDGRLKVFNSGSIEASETGVFIEIDNETAAIYFEHTTHLHQLQNLYYALTQTELTYKPS